MDGSDLAGEVVPWADAWAGALEAEVELVHAVGSAWFAAAASPETVDYFAAHQLAAARQVLENAAAGFQHAKRVDPRLIEGSAADAIVSRAHEGGATLIVMATHGRGGFTRTLLGSVAGSVIHRSRVPVLAVRSGLEQAPGIPKRVLVPLDGLDPAKGILAQVAPLADVLRSELVLYSVVPGSKGTGPETTRRIERVAGDLNARGIHAEVEVEAGADAAGMIASFARRGEFGLIAMTTHGTGGLGRWGFGSVTDRTIRHAPAPVMAVRARGP